MAGITDTVFRMLARHAGADIVVSEMVSAEGIYRKGRNTTALLRFEPAERPIGIQLFGSNPEHLAYAAAYVEQSVHPDFIDLNSGCPVPKVVKKNGGSALLRDPLLLGRILSAMVKAVSTPVTVKIRSGWHEHEWNDIEIARIARDCGVAAITVHPRSKSMGFSGHAYRERITAVKQSVQIPVVGNGDIFTAESGVAMFEQTGCDSVMIARGALGNPWIFAHIRTLQQGMATTEVSPRVRHETARRHIAAYREIHGEKRAHRDMKKVAAWYLKGLAGASEARCKIFASRTTVELECVLDNYFTVHPHTGGPHGTPGVN